jgi:hypothetical protein
MNEYVPITKLFPPLLGSNSMRSTNIHASLAYCFCVLSYALSFRQFEMMTANIILLQAHCGSSSVKVDKGMPFVLGPPLWKTETFGKAPAQVQRARRWRAWQADTVGCRTGMSVHIGFIKLPRQGKLFCTETELPCPSLEDAIVFAKFTSHMAALQAVTGVQCPRNAILM